MLQCMLTYDVQNSSKVNGRVEKYLYTELYVFIPLRNCKKEDTSCDSHLACHVYSRRDMMQRISLVWPLTFLSVCHCFSGANRKHSLACLTAFGASTWGIANQMNVNSVLFPWCTACLEPWNLRAVFFVNVPCCCTRPPTSLSSSFLLCCFLFFLNF